MDSDSEVSKFYVTLPDNKMLGSGRSIIEEFILRDSFSTGLQHMFNALGSILETLIDIVPSDYKFVSFHFPTLHCEKELMADWPKNLPRKGVSRCWRSGGLCGSVSFSSPSIFFRGTLFSFPSIFLLLRLIELRKKHAEGELPSLSSEQIIGQAIIIIIIIIIIL